MIAKIKYKATKLSAIIKLLSIELITVLIAFIGSMVLFGLIIKNIFFEKKQAFDLKVFSFLSQFVNDRNTSVMRAFTFFGSPLFLIIANLLLIVYYLFVKKHKWYSIKIPAISLSCLLLLFGLKYFFNRPRPLIPLLKNVPGFSFPSGHAFMSFAFFGLLIYIVYRDNILSNWVTWASIILLLGFIFMIGLSRIYLRVHYASDVIAGFALGIISMVVLLWILEGFEKKENANNEL